MLGYKANINNFQKTEIIQTTVQDHNAIKLEISNRRLTSKGPYVENKDILFLVTCGSKKNYNRN